MRKIYYILFIFLLFSAKDLVAKNHFTAPDSALLTITDLVVSSDEQSNTIYVADEQSGAVYFYTLSSDNANNETINFDQFKVFYKSSIFTHPYAIAYFQGNLFIC